MYRNGIETTDINLNSPTFRDFMFTYKIRFIKQLTGKTYFQSQKSLNHAVRVRVRVCVSIHLSIALYVRLHFQLWFDWIYLMNFGQEMGVR